MAADTGTTNWPANTDDLNLPSDMDSRAPTSAGDGHYTLKQWYERVTGMLRATATDLLTGMTHDLPMGSHKITGLATPVSGTDAVTKAYVDAVAIGLSPKGSAKAATSSNRALLGLTAVDGYTPSANDRILLTGQSTGSENGLWLAQTGAWTRPSDFATGADVSGAFVFVEGGSTNSGAGFVIANTGPVTVDTTAQTWTQFSGAGEITAGAGLTKTGNTINAVANADASITVNADDIQVAALGITTGKLADGAVTSLKIADGTITDTDVAAANKDGAAGTASMRTLGTGAAQAAAGNDTRITGAEQTANKGANSGYMGLDSAGRGNQPPKVHDVHGASHSDLWVPSGAIAETPSGRQNLVNIGGLVSGRQTFTGITLPSVPITSITFVAGSTLFTPGTNQFFSIYDGTTLGKLALTADDGVTAWAALAKKTLHISRTVTDAAITTGTATLTSATAAFTPADTGRRITVMGAGAAGVPLGTSATPVTMTYVNATTVTLSANAGTTVSGATAYIATPYTPLAEGRFYLGITEAGTVSTLLGTSSLSGNAASLLSPLLSAQDSNHTGLTTPASAPSTMTLDNTTNSNLVPYAYVQ